MGDRGVINFEDTGVQLYAHWAGDDLPAMLHAALGRRERWQDEAYLARIVFCEMIKDDVMGETGFGIMKGGVDMGPDHPVIHVNIGKSTIRVGAETIGFEEFVTSDITRLLMFKDY